jgi:hypothetical protein
LLLEAVLSGIIAQHSCLTLIDYASGMSGARAFYFHNIFGRPKVHFCGLDFLSQNTNRVIA